MGFQRECKVDWERGDQDGVFSGVLATNGEASDGHILNISGGVIQPGLPLLWAHNTDRPLGSWRNFQSDSMRLRGTAQIEMDGPESDGRRDIAHMVSRGHVTGFSLRWDADDADVIPRSELPRDHPAYVSKTERTRKRFGLYFDKWRGVEGSIVSTPSDSDALIGRAKDGPSAYVRMLYWEEHQRATNAAAVDALVEARLQEYLRACTSDDDESSDDSFHLDDPDAFDPPAHDPGDITSATAHDPVASLVERDRYADRIERLFVTRLERHAKEMAGHTAEALRCLVRR